MYLTENYAYKECMVTVMFYYAFVLVFHQLLSIGSSFVSMAWSMASYQRLLRVSLKTKGNITWAGTIVQFMWHFLVTGEFNS